MHTKRQTRITTVQYQLANKNPLPELALFMRSNVTGLRLELTVVGPRPKVASRHSHVVLPRRLQHSKVAIVHSPSHLRWNTHSDRPSRNLQSAWDNTTYSNDTMPSDHRSIEDDRPNPDQALVSDATGVHHSVMSYSNTVTNNAVVLGGAMDHNIVLDATIRADTYPPIISP